MERLTELHVPPEWEAALTACLDEPLPAPSGLSPWFVAIVILCLAAAFAVGIFLLYP